MKFTSCTSEFKPCAEIKVEKPTTFFLDSLVELAKSPETLSFSFCTGNTYKLGRVKEQLLFQKFRDFVVFFADLILNDSFVVGDEAEFVEASRKGNLVPLHKCIFADHLTPVLAYRCLVKEDDREAPSFLFESVEPGFRTSQVVRSSLFI